MRPVVNVSEEDRATDIGNHATCTKIGKDRACDSRDILSDRQTDTQTDPQTDILIAILRNRPRGLSNDEVGDATVKLYRKCRIMIDCPQNSFYIDLHCFTHGHVHSSAV